MHPTVKQMWDDIAHLNSLERQAETDLDTALEAGIAQYELDAEVAAGFRKDRKSNLYLPG